MILSTKFIVTSVTANNSFRQNILLNSNDAATSNCNKINSDSNANAIINNKSRSSFSIQHYDKQIVLIVNNNRSINLNFNNNNRHRRSDDQTTNNDLILIEHIGHLLRLLRQQRFMKQQQIFNKGEMFNNNNVINDKPFDTSQQQQHRKYNDHNNNNRTTNDNQRKSNNNMMINHHNDNFTNIDSYTREIMRLAMEFNRQQPLSIRDYFVIIMYGLIVLISLFGNLLVCKVILFRQTMRNRMTHIFIANLTISDLLMTVFTIPMNIARQILDDWPFGELCCKLVPFVQALSVYVSVLSMTMIAIDRYQALVRPLQPRLTQKCRRWIWPTWIWLLASILSIPYAIFNHVVNVLTLHYDAIRSHGNQQLFRCKAIYPGDDPQYYQRLITLSTFITQFCIPMFIVAYCYIWIAMKISKRSCIGEIIRGRTHIHLQTKRKTIKMLICVVATFAICWLPYNLLYIVEDFVNINFSLTIHYFVHWLAMSSICYNPFIYFWLNHDYRQGILNVLTYCFCRLCGHQQQQQQQQQLSFNRSTNNTLSNITNNDDVMMTEMDNKQSNNCNKNNNNDNRPALINQFITTEYNLNINNDNNNNNDDDDDDENEILKSSII